MRMLLTAHMDMQAANQAVNDGTLRKMVDGMVEDLKPEAAYFLPSEGTRCCMFVFDLEDTARIPVALEPFFLGGAEVELTPVMNLDDLRAGLADVRR